MLAPQFRTDLYESGACVYYSGSVGLGRVTLPTRGHTVKPGGKKLQTTGACEALTLAISIARSTMNMRSLLVNSVTAVTIAVVGLAATPSRRIAAQAPGSAPLVTQAQYDRWRAELSNWGRWGKDDEMGALNLITPARRKAAAALVREGFTVSLSSIVSTEKAVDIPCPAEWGMLTASDAGATDRVGFPCIHGAGATHIDSFAHRFFDGKMWNGYPISGLVTMDNGAGKNSVLTMKDGIVTRAILYDIPRLKGVPYLEPGTRIFASDLEAWEKKAGARVGPGDALLLRWGRWARRAKVGPWPIDEGAAGLDNSIIPWLKQRDIALMGSDHPQYVSPAELAVLYAALGQQEQAFTSLERAFDGHDVQLTFLGIDPAFDSLRDDPRFANLMRRIGLPSIASTTASPL